MHIQRLYQGLQPVYSFEFFPPKTDLDYPALYRTIGDLKQTGPGFVSVTSHARGENRSRTVELVLRIQNELGITAMAHVTCGGQKREALQADLSRLHAGGIRNIMALRGDPPREGAGGAGGAAQQPGGAGGAGSAGGAGFAAAQQPGGAAGTGSAGGGNTNTTGSAAQAPGDFRYANELVAFIKANWDFTVGGACYPETHHEAAGPEADLDNLKRKCDAGVDFLVTQLFLNNAHYFRFVERARAAHIDLPIVPGIMPMIGLRNLRAAMRLSPGSETPTELESALADAQGDAARSFDIGVDFATRQCAALLAAGAPGIHFYTLNKSPATRRVHAGLSQAREARG